MSDQAVPPGDVRLVDEPNVLDTEVAQNLPERGAWLDLDQVVRDYVLRLPADDCFDQLVLIFEVRVERCLCNACSCCHVACGDIHSSVEKESARGNQNESPRGDSVRDGDRRWPEWRL